MTTRIAARIAWWTLIAVTIALVASTTHVSWAAIAGARIGTPPPVCGAVLPGREVPMLPSPHIPFVTSPHARYNSVPPTSGPHVPWVVMTGIYSAPIPNELLVHVLEHGHINIQYGRATPPADVAVLRAIALRFPNDVVLVPYPELASGIALTAWGHIETMQHANRADIINFIVDLRGRYNHGWSWAWVKAHCAAASRPGSRLTAQLVRATDAAGCG